MKKEFSLVLAVLVIGVLLAFIHLGIFVYIYLPACFVLALVILVKRKIKKRKVNQVEKKPKPVAKPKVIRVPRYPKFRKILGLVTLLIIFPITPLLGYLTWFPGKEGPPGPLLFLLMFVDFNFIFFTYPALITGFYLLLSKKVQRITGVVLLVTIVPLELILWVPSVVFLLKGQTGHLYLFPMLILVPAAIIYSIFEPAKLKKH